MSEEIKAQLVRNIKDGLFGLFSIQLDKSTDVASISQFICFATHNSIKESMLFCKPLETTTKAIDVKKKVSEFFKA